MNDGDKEGGKRQKDMSRKISANNFVAEDNTDEKMHENESK